jgi:rhodanese-related sulfurtransferase
LNSISNGYIYSDHENIFTTNATISAYQQGQQWLDAFLSHTQNIRNWITEFMNEEYSMPQTITKGIKALQDEAYRVVDDISIAEAKALFNDDNYVFVDVREAEERQTLGVIPGAFTCSRGMLEFLIDSACPFHNKIFNQDKTYVFYCARGLRSLYAAKTAADMGLTPVKNLAGGFAEWVESGGAVES